MPQGARKKEYDAPLTVVPGRLLGKWRLLPREFQNQPSSIPVTLMQLPMIRGSDQAVSRKGGCKIMNREVCYGY
jgi:hypothetical protein